MSSGTNNMNTSPGSYSIMLSRHSREDSDRDHLPAGTVPVLVPVSPGDRRMPEQHERPSGVHQ